MKQRVIKESILELWLERELFEMVETIHQNFYGGQPLVRRKLNIWGLLTVQQVLYEQYGWQTRKNKKMMKTLVEMDLSPYTHVFIYREF